MQKISINYDKRFVLEVKNHVETVLHKYPRRLKHIQRVAKRAKKLAEIHGLNTHKVQVAAYLHDVTKKWSNSEHVLYLETEEAHLYKKHPYYLHAASAAKYAKKTFNIDDEDITNAVYYHSTGRSNMSPIEKVIVVADMCEPKRKRWNAKALYKTAKNDLNHALVQSLHIKIQHFIETKNEPHKNLKEAYEFYKENIWTK